MASSIPAARTTLYAGLQALTATGQPLEGVGVYRTGLWREEQAHDRVTVLNARNILRTWASLGAYRLEETYTLPVAVEVYRTGADLAYVETRLWAIITEIEKYVLGNLTLGGVLKFATPAGAIDPEQAGPSSQDEDTLLGMLTVRIDCTARVSLA